MKKIKILDTNVFLSDPKAMFNYPDELLVIPISVIEEIDKFKKEQNELGRNARMVLRKMDKLRKRGKISSPDKDKEGPGIALNNGGRLIIELNHTDKIPHGLTQDMVDNRLLAVALWYKENFKDSELTFITKDANLRIKADALDLITTDYELPSNKTPDSFYMGYREEKAEVETIKELRKKREVPYEGDANANEFVLLSDKNSDEETADQEVGRVELVEESSTKRLVTLEKVHEVFGITAINAEQVLALDLLLNPDIPLVTITGKAGTGKTLLAVAAGLSQCLDNDRYLKVLVSRPVFPMGKDIGFLPGTMEEKLNPWMQPIFDNLDFIFSQGSNRKMTRNQSAPYLELMERGVLKVEALTYIRGRSIPQQFMIVDEAQNLTLHEVKTIVTRAGKDTKIIFTGDPEQIDNPYVDSQNNGLTLLIERLKDDKLTGHVHLSQGERSPLAEMASIKLSDNR